MERVYVDSSDRSTVTGGDAEPRGDEVVGVGAVSVCSGDELAL